MKFVDVAVADAAGAVLAHTHRLGAGKALKKGHVVTEADTHALAAAGLVHVAAARLEDGDLDEDEAARRVATAITGRHLTVARPLTGRANIFARTRGVFVVSRDRLDALNTFDEAITVATLPPYSVVEAGAMTVTVKIIPFAVAAEVVAGAIARAGVPAGDSLCSVAPFVKKRAGLVLTRLPGIQESQLELASGSQRRRMAYLGGEIVTELRVEHDTESVAAAIEAMLAERLDLILVLGASAVVDRKDVVPTAIEAVGGGVDHLGMPVDPGNLLLLGHHGATPIVGVPGCARSLKPSGFDWVLERLVADLPITRLDIMRLGAGGLLAEPARRPPVLHASAARIAAIVLAAGRSRRMGGTNKLLAEIEDKAIVVRVVDALLASKASPVLVVVGHEADRIRAALADRDVRFVENASYEEGLGSSLRAGASALGDDVDGALIALGDMPWIRAEHADAVIDAFDPHGSNTICVPVHDRKRGHPVLLSARHFGELRKLGGDVGARELLERHANAVLSVEVDDAAVHIDVDTRSMLEAAKNGRS